MRHFEFISNSLCPLKRLIFCSASQRPRRRGPFPEPAHDDSDEEAQEDLSSEDELLGLQPQDYFLADFEAPDGY